MTTFRSASEVLSVVGKASLMGVPIPRALRKVLRDKNDEEDSEKK